jgi:hypothetical protein
VPNDKKITPVSDTPADAAPPMLVEKLSGTPYRWYPEKQLGVKKGDFGAAKTRPAVVPVRNQPRPERGRQGRPLELRMLLY